MPLNVGLRSCGALCPHPGCWDAVRKQEKGITKSLPPLDFSSSDDSDSDLDLPTQSVCNLLSDFGESPTDRYPLSTGGRPSHKWDTPIPPAHSAESVVRRKESTLSPKKLHAPHNTKASLFSKMRSTGIPAPRPRPRQPRMPLVEVQEVFDRTDLNSQWDETFVTKQYYIWVANPQKKKKRRMGGLETQRDPNGPVLMKDMTECMVPPEIEQQREDTVLFDEWPVLKKRQPRTASPPSKSIQFKKAAMSQAPALPAPPPVDVDMEGINELLALPKDVLLKVLEHTNKSDFTSKGKIHEIVQECIQGNDSARMMLSTRELLRQKKMKILNIPKGTVHKSLPAPPSKQVFHVDEDDDQDPRPVVDGMRAVAVVTPGAKEDKDADAFSDDSSVESFPKYRKPLPKIRGYPHLSYHLVGPGELIHAEPEAVRLPVKAKLPSISLGLPELPSGVKTTRAFAYNNKNSIDFSLGPVISPPTTHRSSESGDYSEHGTTVKVNAPTSGFGYADNDMLIHCVSPALSTHVPVAPAVTPATFMSPTKSAPNLRDISRDPTQVTVNLSLRAQLSSSKDMRETTFLSSPTTGQPLPCQQPPSPLHDLTKVSMTPDEKGLDTIRETARETVGVEGSVISSPHGTMGDRMEEPPRLVLQTSSMTNINTGTSPVPKSARSVESCPSPEQWPLISESSFEKMVPRSSVSEPALSGRSGGRRTISRGLDDNGRDYARKVMVEKNSAESPAPPPPSPEPKDSNEYRARKDLKSRESLSMAPLFEVNEIDEDGYNEVEKDGRRKQVRKIHAVIPQANTESEDDRKKLGNEEPEEEEEQGEVMVSQITVMHVAPKGAVSGSEQYSGTGGGGGSGGNVKREKEKVQETFLNVDIPAEEISSCKAEHGSSRQEDISSTNDSAADMATTTNSQVSTSVASNKENKKEEEEEEGGVQGGTFQYEQSMGLHDNGEQQRDEEKQDDVEDEGKVDGLEEKQYLEMQSDFIHRDAIDSARLNSEDSGVSPELVCDSARFMSHDLVSPMDGDMDEGQLQMMLLLQQVEGRNDAGEGAPGGQIKSETGEQTNRSEQAVGDDNNEKDEQDTDLMAEEYGKILGELDDVGEREILGEESKTDEECLGVTGKGETEKSAENEDKSTPGSDDLEPPGSFFFQANGAEDEGNINTDTAEFLVTVNTDETAENKKSSDLSEIVADNGQKEEGEVENVIISEKEPDGQSDDQEGMSMFDKIQGMLCGETNELDTAGTDDAITPEVKDVEYEDDEQSKEQVEQNGENNDLSSESEALIATGSEGNVDKQAEEWKEVKENEEGSMIASAPNDDTENGQLKTETEVVENTGSGSDTINSKNEDGKEGETEHLLSENTE